MPASSNANVMTVEVRATVEGARDSIKSFLTEAQKAAANFRAELELLRQTQISVRNSINDTREAYHRAVEGIKAARLAIKDYNTELTSLSAKEKDMKRALRELADAQTAYNEARRRAGGGTQGVAAEFNALQAAKGAVQQLTAAYGSLSDIKNRQSLLSNQLQTEKARLEALSRELLAQKAALNGNTEAQARLSNTIASVNANIAANNNKIREGKQELQEHERALKADNKALQDLNRTGLTGAILAAELLEEGLQRLWQILRSVTYESVLYAGRTLELDIALTNVARTNGKNIGEIKAYEGAIKNLGITTQDTRDSLIKLVAADLDISKAPALARVAQDLAVVAGVDTSEEINRLVNGIETLQIRALRTAGVFVSLDGALDKAAKASGRARDSFSEQEKQQILMNEVLDYGTRATGTYEKAMETASKQMRTLNRLTAEAQNAFGGMIVFQGIFLIAVKSIEAFLRLVAAAPLAMTVVVGAFTILGVSILKSTSTGTLWANKLREIAVALGQATKASFGYMAATNAVGTAQARSMFGAPGPLALNQRRGQNLSNTAKYGTGIGLGVAVGAGSYMTGASLDESVINGLGGAAVGFGATALAAGAVSGGVGAVIIALGALVPAIYSAIKANEDFKTISAEVLDLQLRRIKVAREDAEAFRNQAAVAEKNSANYKLSVEETARLNMAVERLSITDKRALEVQLQKVNVLGISAAALRDLADATDKVNAAEKERVLTSLRANVDINDKRLQDIREKGEELRSAEAYYASEARASKAGTRFEMPFITSMVDSIFGGDPDKLNTDIAKMTAQSESFYKALNNAYLEFYPNQQKSIEAFVKEDLQLNENTEAYNRYVSKIKDAYLEYQVLTGKVVDAAKAGEIYRKKLEELKPTQFDVGVTSQGIELIYGRLVNQLKNSAAAIELNKGAMFDYSDVLAGNASALMNFDNTLKSASLGSQDKYNEEIEKIKASNPEFLDMLLQVKVASTATVKGIGDDQIEAVKRLRDVQKRLLDAQREIKGLMEGGISTTADPNNIAAAQLERLEARLKIIRSEIDAIESARINLGVDEGLPISESREARQEMLLAYQNVIKVRDGLRDLINEQKNFVFEVAKAQQAASLGIISASDLAAKAVADNLRTRRQAEQQLTADIITMTVDRADALKNELNESEEAYKSYYKGRLEELEKSRQERLTAEAELEYLRGERTINPVTLKQYGQFDLNLPDTPVPTKEEIEAVKIQGEIAKMVFSSNQVQQVMSNAVQTLDNTVKTTSNDDTSKLIQSQVQQTDRIVTELQINRGYSPLGGPNLEANPVPTNSPLATAPHNYGMTNQTVITPSMAQAAQLNSILQQGANNGRYDRNSLQRAVQYAAQMGGINATVAQNQVLAESSYKTGVTSPKGAGGLTQMMPGTFNKWKNELKNLYGITNPDRYNPLHSLLAYQLEMGTLNRKYQGNYDMSLSAYNAGEGATDAYMYGGSYTTTKGKRVTIPKDQAGRLVPFAETVAYRNKILGRTPMSPQVVGTQTVTPLTPIELETQILGEKTKTVEALTSELAFARKTSFTDKEKAGVIGLHTRVGINAAEQAIKLLRDERDTMYELRGLNRVESLGYYSDDKLAARSADSVTLEQRRGLLSARQQQSNLKFLDTSGYFESDAFKQRITVDTDVKLREERKASIENLAMVKEREAQITATVESQTKYRQTLLDNAEADRIKKLRETHDRITLLEEDANLRTERDAMWVAQMWSNAYENILQTINESYDNLETARARESVLEEKAAEYRKAIANNVETARITEARKSKDRIIEIEEELTNRIVNFNAIVEESDRKTAIARYDAFKAASDDILRLNSEDRDRIKNAEQYKINATLGAEVERRKEMRQTTDDYDKFLAQENSGWFNSIEYKTMLEQKFYVERKQNLTQMRDALVQANEYEKDAFERMQLEKAAAAQKAETYTRDRNHEALLQQIQDMAVIEDSAHFHIERFDAALTSWRAKQKGLTELFADSVTGTLDTAFSLIDKFIGKATQSLGPFSEVITQLFGGLIKFGISDILTKLTNKGDGAATEGKGLLDGFLSIFTGKSAKTDDGAMNVITSRVQTMYVGTLISGGAGGGLPSTGNSLIDSAVGILTGGSIFNRGGGSGGSGADSNLSAVSRLLNLSSSPNYASGSFASQNSVANQSQAARLLGLAPTNFGSQQFGLNTGQGAAQLGSLSQALSGGLSAVDASRFTAGGAQTPTASSHGGAAPPRGLPSSAAAGGGMFGRYSSGIGALASGLISSYGANLGGTSAIGGILGSAGGLIGGTLISGLITSGSIAGATTGGIFGASAGILGLSGAATFGIGLAVAGALMLGAYIFGKQKQRKTDERTRNSAMGDALRQLNEILENVRLDKMSGEDGIAAADNIRRQYMDQMGQLKDGKTRRIALKDVSRLDVVIGQIKAAAESQKNRQAVNSEIVPEFASGTAQVGRGFASAQANAARRANRLDLLHKLPKTAIMSKGSGFIVGGHDYGFDSVPALLKPREAVLNEQHIMNLGGYEALRRAGVPNVPSYATGGDNYAVQMYRSGGFVSNQTPTVSSTSSGTSSNNNEGESNIYLVTDRKFAEAMARQAGGVIVEMGADDIRHEGRMFGALKSKGYRL